MKTGTRGTPVHEQAVDPVCGMSVDADSPITATHGGETYHFCSEHCRSRFVKDPERFVRASGAATGDRRDQQRQRTRRADDRSSAQPTAEDPVHRRVEARGRKWTDYLPLMVIVALSAVAAAASQYAYDSAWSGRAWMHHFMGLFLVFFSMFKFFDLSGFADGFQMYDLLAKPFRPYAYVYPFIELSLGLGYLGTWNLPFIYGATVVVMMFGALGVMRALARRLDVNCACMGTVLKVPLSTVALTEDLGMAAMAAWMWFTLP